MGGEAALGPWTTLSANGGRSVHVFGSRPRNAGEPATPGSRRSDCWRLRGSPEHLLDITDVRLFFEDHSPRVLFEKDRASLDEVQELPAEGEAVLFVLERFAQEVAEVVAVGLEQRPDRKRGVFPEVRDLPGVLRVQENSVACVRIQETIGMRL